MDIMKDTDTGKGTKNMNNTRPAKTATGNATHAVIANTYKGNVSAPTTLCGRSYVGFFAGGTEVTCQKCRKAAGMTIATSAEALAQWKGQK